MPAVSQLLQPRSPLILRRGLFSPVTVHDWSFFLHVSAPERQPFPTPSFQHGALSLAESWVLCVPPEVFPAAWAAGRTEESHFRVGASRCTVSAASTAALWEIHGQQAQGLAHLYSVEEAWGWKEGVVQSSTFQTSVHTRPLGSWLSCTFPLSCVSS